MKKYRIVLASASPRRQELLRQIGLSFEVLPAQGEEKIAATGPETMVLALSGQKAEEVFKKLEGQQRRAGDVTEPLLVIGADTVVACGHTVLGKPHDANDARRMLQLLQGRSHDVYTGVTVIWQEEGEQRFSFFSRTRVSFYPMSREDIRDYVATGEPMDKAGAYGIQGRCAAYISGVEGDYNNVVGLPVGRLYQEMHQRRIL